MGRQNCLIIVNDIGCVFGGAALLGAPRKRDAIGHLFAIGQPLNVVQ